MQRIQRRHADTHRLVGDILVRIPAELAEHGLEHDKRTAAQCGNADGLAFQVLDLLYAGLGVHRDGIEIVRYLHYESLERHALANTGQHAGPAMGGEIHLPGGEHVHCHTGPIQGQDFDVQAFISIEAGTDRNGTEEATIGGVHRWHAESDLDLAANLHQRRLRETDRAGGDGSGEHRAARQLELRH